MTVKNRLLLIFSANLHFYFIFYDNIQLKWSIFITNIFVNLYPNKIIILFRDFISMKFNKIN